MITLANVRDWLKSYDIAEHYYIGKLDNKQDKSIGVYSLKRSGSPVIPFGGMSQSTYDVKSISVLVHWNKNAAETEQAAYELFNKLLSETDLKINDKQVYLLRLNFAEPVDIGTDNKGVYERVIEFEIFYQRSD